MSINISVLSTLKAKKAGEGGFQKCDFYREKERERVSERVKPSFFVNPIDAVSISLVSPDINRFLNICIKFYWYKICSS